MAWTTPPTFVTAQVVTAAQLNQLSNDLVDLDARTRPAGASLTAGADTTTSTTYTDLSSSVGPTVTLTTGTSVIVVVTAQMFNNNGPAAMNMMGFAVSGATTLAASDLTAVWSDTYATAPAGNYNRMSAVSLVTGLIAGSNTFTAKYRVSSGTGTFGDRSIVVWPANNLS